MTQKGFLNTHVLPLFGGFKLDKLTIPLIQPVMNKLANSTNTGEVGAYLHCGKIHNLNKRILQYGVILQVIPTSPADNVVLPRNTQKDKKAKVKHFNNEELKQFLTTLVAWITLNIKIIMISRYISSYLPLVAVLTRLWLSHGLILTLIIRLSI